MISDETFFKIRSLWYKRWFNELKPNGVPQASYVLERRKFLLEHIEEDDVAGVEWRMTQIAAEKRRRCKLGRKPRKRAEKPRAPKQMAFRFHRSAA